MGRFESRALTGVVVALQGLYLLSAVVPNPFFGVNQLSSLGWPWCAAILAAAWAAASWLERRRPVPSGRRPTKRREGRRLGYLAAACLGMALFLLLPSGTLNPDGQGLLVKIPRDVQTHGAHVTHDEMLELYLHSRLYYYMNLLEGWSVVDSYRAAAAAAGGVFLILLLLTAERLVSRGHRGLFLALALSGGYLQLYFGDVENYALVTTAILAYMLASYEHLRDRAALWVPSLTLSVAIGLHLLAGWLLPSLAWLHVRALARGRPRDSLVSLGALLLPLVGLLVAFHFHGLPLQRLFDSSHVSGMGGHYDRYVAPMNPWYFVGIANIVLLLLPSVVVLPVLIAFRRIGNDPTARFTQVAALGMLAFTLLWRAQLGLRHDWNLYAAGAVPMGLMIACGSSQAYGGPDRRTCRIALWALAFTAAAHSAAWILHNHSGRL